jgi:hypothetical protein
MTPYEVSRDNHGSSRESKCSSSGIAGQLAAEAGREPGGGSNERIARSRSVPRVQGLTEGLRAHAVRE